MHGHVDPQVVVQLLFVNLLAKLTGGLEARVAPWLLESRMNDHLARTANTGRIVNGVGV